jgi:hypothetical protein
MFLKYQTDMMRKYKGLHDAANKARTPGLGSIE